MSIGKNIKELRGKYNLSQKEFAEIAGVTDKAVSTWENELKEPRMGVIQKIADYYGLQKSDLIEEGGVQRHSMHETPTERKLALLARNIDKLPEEDRDRLMNNFEDTIDIYLAARGIKEGE